MPYTPIKFKSDKEIEKEETTNSFGVKVRRHNPMDFQHWYDCWYCSNIVKPKCKLNIPFSKENGVIGCYPCVRDCQILIKEHVMGDICRFYERATCKEGYPVSEALMDCPAYNGPKPQVDYLGEFVMISYPGNIDSKKTKAKRKSK